jgi:hypothetical protein
MVLAPSTTAVASGFDMAWAWKRLAKVSLSDIDHLYGAPEMQSLSMNTRHCKRHLRAKDVKLP